MDQLVEEASGWCNLHFFQLDELDLSILLGEPVFQILSAFEAIGVGGRRWPVNWSFNPILFVWFSFSQTRGSSHFLGLRLLVDNLLIFGGSRARGFPWRLFDRMGLLGGLGGLG